MQRANQSPGFKFLDVFISYYRCRLVEKKNSSQDFANAKFSLCLSTHSNSHSLFCDGLVFFPFHF